MKRFWPFLILFLLPILPLREAMFNGNAIGPWDQIRQFAPWNGPEPNQPWDVLQADGALQFAQWRSLVLESWSRGQAPIWNPYQFGGTALAANSQSGAYYPFHIGFGLLQIGVWPALTLLAWIHLAIAGWGTYCFARRLGANELGGFVAGATFAMSPFMLSWTGLPSVITTVCWIPVGLALITAAALDDDVSWLIFAIRIGVVGAMMATAGHLQFLAYGVGAWVLWSFALMPMAIRNKRVGAFAASTVTAAILTGLIAFPAIAPVLKYSEFSHRRNSPTAEGYNAYVSSAIKPFELANLSAPTVLGNPREFIAIGETKAPGYWVPFLKRGANFAESAVTVGALALMLLVFAPWRRPSTIAVGVLGGLALLVALGTPLNAALYFGIPGWSSTGSPGRIIFLFVLAVAVLAALGITNLTDKPKPLPLVAGLALALVPLALYSGGLGDSTRLAEMGLDPQTMASWVQAALSQGIIAVLIGLVLAAIAIAAQISVRRGKMDAKLANGVLVGAVISGVAFQPSWIMTGRPLDPLDAPANERIAFVNEPWEIVAAAPAIVPPNLATGSRVMDIAGYDSLIHRDTIALLNDINGQDSAPPANGNMMFIKPTADPEKLRAAGVTEVWSRRELPIAFGLPEMRNGYAVYRLDGPGIVTNGKLESISPSGFVATATGPGTATIRFRNLGILDFFVNGEKVEVKSQPWIELELPEGEHRIEGRAPGNPMLAILIALSLVSALVAFAVSLNYKRSDESADPSA